MTELLILLAITSLVSGLLTAAIHNCASLLLLPVVSFFLPSLGYSSQQILPILIATCLVAQLPSYLYLWLQSAGSGANQQDTLFAYAPGLAMGGVIGAQLLPLLSFTLIQSGLFIMLVITSLQLLWSGKSHHKQWLRKEHPLKLFIGILIATLSMLGANSGKTLLHTLLPSKSPQTSEYTGQINGLVLFVGVGAMLGFVFPAVVFSSPIQSHTLGLISLPWLLVIMVSHFIGLVFFQRFAKQSDFMVIKIFSGVFFIVCAIRLAASF